MVGASGFTLLSSLPEQLSSKQKHREDGKQYWSLQLLQSTRGNTMYSDHDVHVGAKVSKVGAQFHTSPGGCVLSGLTITTGRSSLGWKSLGFQHNQREDGEECHMTCRVLQRRPRSTWHVRVRHLYAHGTSQSVTAAGRPPQVLAADGEDAPASGMFTVATQSPALHP